LQGGEVIAIAVGLVMLALGVWSLTWRRLAAGACAERELFHGATGSYCDPNLLPDDMSREFTSKIEQTWRERWSDVSRRASSVASSNRPLRAARRIGLDQIPRVAASRATRG
jgi:hypothetical protein